MYCNPTKVISLSVFFTCKKREKGLYYKKLYISCFVACKYGVLSGSEELIMEVQFYAEKLRYSGML